MTQKQLAAHPQNTPSMEPRTLSWAALPLLLAFLALHEGIHPNPTTSASAAAAIPKHRCVRQHRHVKNMVFYMHDLLTAKTPTAVPVAAQNGQLASFKLGLTLVIDDKLTMGPHPESTEIGRGQGFYTLASLTAPDLFLSFTAVFHKPALYNGSTICLHGSDRTMLAEREIGIAGGTGVFRFAQGYAILSTVSIDGFNAIIKFNLTMVL